MRIVENEGKRMGRRKKDPSDRKKERIEFRVTVDDWAEINRRAMERDMNISEYIRNAALGQIPGDAYKDNL